MICVVTGGQTFTDEAQICADLRALIPLGLKLVVHGACPTGADAFADRIARALLGPEGVKRFHADWSLGKRGGPLRNTAMLEATLPNVVLSYPTPDSRGTWHCSAEAVRLGIRTLAYIPWWDGDVAELVQQKTRRYGRVTGERQGSHVVLRAIVTP